MTWEEFKKHVDEVIFRHGFKGNEVEIEYIDVSSAITRIELIQDKEFVDLRVS